VRRVRRTVRVDMQAGRLEGRQRLWQAGIVVLESLWVSRTVRTHTIQVALVYDRDQEGGIDLKRLRAPAV
jgi:hypothetical protein